MADEVCRDRDPRGEAERRDTLALVAGCVVAGALGVIALGVSRDYGFGDSAGLAASAYDLGLPQSAEHPVWVLFARTIYSIAPSGGPAWAANALTALTGVVALAAIALACLETIHTTRALMPQRGYTLRRLDYWIAGLCATTFLSAPGLRETLSHASTWPASLALGAAFLWLTQRWRRLGALSACHGFALLAVAGLAVMHEPWLVTVVVSGLLAVAFYGSSMAHREPQSPVVQPRRGVRALLVIGGLALGASPALLSAWFAARGAPDQMGPHALWEYLLGDFARPGFHNVGVLAAPLAARDAIERIADAVGAPLGLLAVLGVVWASVDRAIVGATTCGRSASAGLWPGALCFIVGWMPAWSYTGWDRSLALLPCALGCALMAAAGAAMLLEGAQSLVRRHAVVEFAVVATLAVGLAVNVAVRPGQVGGAASDLARSTLDSLPARTVAVVGDDLCAPEHLVYPLSYEQRVHGTREDIALIGVEGAFTEADWARIADAGGLGREPLGHGEGWMKEMRGSPRPVASTEWSGATPSGGGTIGPFMLSGGRSRDAPAGLQPQISGDRLSPMARDMQTVPLRISALAGSGGVAEFQARSALSIAPESAANHVALAVVRIREGEAADAFVTADRARHLDPLNAQAWLVRARALGDLGCWDDAARSAEVAASVARRDSDLARASQQRYAQRASGEKRDNAGE